MRLSDVDTRRLSGTKYKLMCHFKLVAEMVGGGIQVFVIDMVKPGFLERKLIGLGVDGYQ